MILGEFSSVVQLGVGLHGGTALLQSSGELAASPLSSRADRLSRFAQAKAADDEAFVDNFDQTKDLKGDLEAKRIIFLSEYRFVVLANGCVALVVLVALAWAAFDADEKISWEVGLLLTFLSFGPALASLFLLTNRWNKMTRPLRGRLKSLEDGLLQLKKKP